MTGNLDLLRLRRCTHSVEVCSQNASEALGRQWWPQSGRRAPAQRCSRLRSTRARFCRGQGRAQHALGRRAMLKLLKNTFQCSNVSLVFLAHCAWAEGRLTEAFLHAVSTVGAVALHTDRLSRNGGLTVQAVRSRRGDDDDSNAAATGPPDVGKGGYTPHDRHARVHQRGAGARA